MYEVVKSPLAKSDLNSFNKWGEDQAVKYLLQLDAGMQRLTGNPKIGKTREKIREGYRSVHIYRHVIYYRLQGKNIDIVRVLHERMIPEKHL